jgi:ion channel
MPLIFFTATGTFLLLLVTHDVYVTILHARGHSGPITEAYCRVIWKATRAIAFKLSRSRRHRMLNAVGPILMPTLIILQVGLILVGFALIYYPRMPESFIVSEQASSSAWAASLYFSGTTLTTLGYGDISPRTMGMRFLSLVESGSGFALISLAVTYLVAVYRALERKRAMALAFYHQVQEGPDAVSFIVHHFVAGRLSGIASNLRTTARDLQEVFESHLEHPIIHYFHPTQVYKSLPRVLFLSLEICAVLKSSLDETEYREISGHPEVRTLESSALHVLEELTDLLKAGEPKQTGSQSLSKQAERWKARFKENLIRLKESGIKTETDEPAALMVYQAHRDEWELKLYRLSYYLGYDWNEITGDRG